MRGASTRRATKWRKFLPARPGATLAYVAAAEPYSDPALLEHLLDGLRKAGLQ